MKEADIRKWHRTVGMILAIFIMLQVISGIILSIEDLLGTYWSGIIHDIHEGFSSIGNTYRIILGTGLLWMVITGGVIAMKIHQRMKQRSNK